MQNKLGRHFSIIPGMVATVDIKTGEKTIVDYLIKPFNRTKVALRERQILAVKGVWGLVTCVTSLLYLLQHIGADSGFDGIRETQGACRGAVGLVKSRKKIVANDENYALAA